MPQHRIALLARTSICPCGYRTVLDSIEPGAEYRVYPTRRFAGASYTCGGCGKTLVVEAILASSVANPPARPILFPVGLFDLPDKPPDFERYTIAPEFTRHLSESDVCLICEHVYMTMSEDPRGELLALTATFRRGERFKRDDGTKGVCKWLVLCSPCLELDRRDQHAVRYMQTVWMGGHLCLSDALNGPVPVQ